MQVAVTVTLKFPMVVPDVIFSHVITLPLDVRLTVDGTTAVGLPVPEGEIETERPTVPVK